MLGGVLVTVLSVRATGLIGGCLVFLWVFFSPVRSLRTIPGGEPERGAPPTMPLAGPLAADADAAAVSSPESSLAVEEAEASQR